MVRVPELVIGLTLLTTPFEMVAQQPATPQSSTTAEEVPLSSEEETESYDIYSTVLQVKGPGPAVADWTIVPETRAFPMCLKPADDQESIYRPIINDYALKSKNTVALQWKFKLGAYTLAGPEAWASAQSIRRNPPVDMQHRTFAVFSAVGFQPRPDTRTPLFLGERVRYVPFHGQTGSEMAD